MKFEDLAFEYELEFDEQPPILTTVDTNDRLYLKLIEDAIESGEKLTRDYLASIFMRNDKVAY